jgi:hypothetical protein
MPWRVMDARIGDVKAQNITPEDLYTSGRRFPEFDEELNPDPNCSKKSDPDPHWSEKMDPDPHYSDADPD